MQATMLRSISALALFCLLSACASTSPHELLPTPATINRNTPAEKAGWRAQVIYLVMPDRFQNGDPSNDNAGSPDCFDPNDAHRYHGGDLAGVRQRLPYLKELGVTALWLTPLYRQIPRLSNGQCGYHGYWIDYVDPDDGAIEPKLGTPATLKALSDDLHANAMRLILDMVVNHSGNIAQIPHQHPSWFHDPATCRQLGDPLIYCPLDSHPDFAQEQPQVAAYLSNAAARWTSSYALDGIRMDTAKYVLPSYFQNSFFPAVRGANPNLFAVAEIFDLDTPPFIPYLDAGFDSAFHFQLRAALVSGIAHSGSIDDVARAVADGIATLGIDRALDLVLLIDNHDVQRFVNEPGWGVPEDEIRRRTLLALDLIFTLPGIPQLYYGDEIGLYGGGDPDNRRDMPAWSADAASRGVPHPGQAVGGSDQIFAQVAKLANLRTHTPALIDGDYRELWRQNGPWNPNVFAFARGAGAGVRVVVLNNGAAHSGPMSIPIGGDLVPDGTVLVDELGVGAPASLTLAHGRLNIDLPAHTAAIYRIGP